MTLLLVAMALLVVASCYCPGEARGGVGFASKAAEEGCGRRRHSNGRHGNRRRAFTIRFQ